MSDIITEALLEMHFHQAQVKHLETAFRRKGRRVRSQGAVARGLGSDQVNSLIEQIISIKKALIPGLEPQFERQTR